MEDVTEMMIIAEKFAQQTNRLRKTMSREFAK